MSTTRTRSAHAIHPAMASLPSGAGEGVARAARRRPRVIDDGLESLPSIAPRPTTRSTRKRRAPSTHAVAAAPSNEASPAPKKRARQKAGLKKPPPTAAVADSAEEEDKKPSADVNCCICMCAVEPDDLSAVNGCDHQFCFGCIEKWSERENSCPLCKVRFTKIDRLNKKRKKGTKNTKKVKNRDQRSDLIPGAALEGLLGRMLESTRSAVASSNDLSDLFSSANFASRHGNQPSLARLIFSSSGGGGFEINSVGSTTTRVRTTISGNPFRDEPNWSSEDDEDSPLSTFLRAFSGVGGMPTVRPVSVSHARFTSSRSHASNHNVSGAGSSAENALSIDSSDDDDDDDVVQVVRVRQGRPTRRGA